ncbi:hypothetical protein BH10CHL1_BH10CHL1_49840 [soil metagenome]
MSVKELAVQEIETLSDVELQEVITYVTFLKSRKRRARMQALPSAPELARLYAEFADEDRQLAEEDMSTYCTALVTEDGQ